MSKCVYKIQNQTDKTQIDFSGHFDETFPSQMIDEIPKDKELIFNLDKVTNINSLGIRAWIKLIQGLQYKSICFINCPKVFVDQVNSVQGFIPAQSKVMSFYVPYFNEDADEEKSVLYSYGKDYSETFNNIPNNLDGSGAAGFEIDVLINKYFNFIKGV